MGISRRGLLVGGVAAAGAGGIAAAMRGIRSQPVAPGGTRLPPSTPEQNAAPTDVAPTSSPTPLPRGGVVRRSSAVSLSFDTFDALRTGEVSVSDVLGKTHSRLVRWANVPSDGSIGELAGGLARTWEQPGATMITLHLDPAARWHDGPLLTGRPVSAEDVVQHLRRRMSLGSEPGLPLVQRGWAMASFESAEAVDAGTVRIRLREPDAFALETLAARFAFVQAPDLVDELDGRWATGVEHATGSGPWIATGVDDRRLTFEASMTGDRRPALDGLEVHGPVARPHAGDLSSRDEWVVRDRRDVAEFDANTWSESRAFEDVPIVSTFNVGAAPWNDARLVRALSFALNRRWMVEALFGADAVGSSGVPAVHGAFAPGDAELRKLGGFDVVETDAAEARRAWDAAGVTGPVVIDFPSVFDPRYSASSIITGRLREVLGGDFRAAIDSYPNIAKKAADGYYGNGRLATWFGWGVPFAEPDPGPWLRETYHSSSATARANGFASGDVDRTLDRVQTVRRDERPALYSEVARMLAAETSGGVLHWAVETHRRFVRRGVGGLDTSPWNAWLDATEVFRA